MAHEDPTSRVELDMATLGETMVGFIREPAIADRYTVTPIGAESNVAIGMAQLGRRTRWVSRLGDDEIGAFVVDFVRGYGVDVVADRDVRHQTGVAIKERRDGGTKIRYYRRDSAASRLNTSHARCLGTPRWIHLTGITPVLSESAAGLVDSILHSPVPRRSRISFDVNYRAALWPDPESAARTLIPLARRADLVFIGDDEAETLLGTSDAAEVRRQLVGEQNQEVVLKRGGGDATYVSGTGTVSEPARQTQVVELTGAGDAFAAGYLTAACWDWEPSERLRLGHFLASRVVGVSGDVGPSIESAELDRVMSTISSTAVAKE